MSLKAFEERRLSARIEGMFKNLQIRLQPSWEDGYWGRVGGKVVHQLPMPAQSPEMTLSEAADLLGTSNNVVSSLLEQLEIRPNTTPTKVLISQEDYEKIARYRTSVYYSMVARWMLKAKTTKSQQLKNQVAAVAAKDPIVSKIFNLL